MEISIECVKVLSLRFTIYMKGYIIFMYFRIAEIGSPLYLRSVTLINICWCTSGRDPGGGFDGMGRYDCCCGGYCKSLGCDLQIGWSKKTNDGVSVTVTTVIDILIIWYMQLEVLLMCIGDLGFTDEGGSNAWVNLGGDRMNMMSKFGDRFVICLGRVSWKSRGGFVIKALRHSL